MAAHFNDERESLFAGLAFKSAMGGARQSQHGHRQKGGIYINESKS